MVEGNSKDEPVKAVAKGAAFIFVGMLGSKLFTYLYRILVARSLGPEEYGLFALGFSFFTLPMVFSALGIGQGVNRYVSKYIGREDQGRIRGTYLAALQMNVPVALVTAAAIFLAAPFIAENVFNHSRLTPILRLFGLAIPLKTFMSDTTSVLKAFQRMDLYAITDLLLQSISALAIAAALIWLGFGIEGAVIGWTASFLITGVVAAYLMERKVFPMFTGSWGPNYQHRTLFSYSWPLVIGGAVGVVQGETDTLMLGFFDTVENVGLYNAAFTIAKTIPIATTSLGMILFPMVSEYIARGRDEDALRIVNVALRWGIAFTVPAVIALILYPDQILQLFFGSAFQGGALPLIIVSLSMLVAAITTPVTKLLGVYDKTQLMMWNSVVAAGANVPLNLLLVPSFGMVGAAVATAVSSVVGTVLAVTEVTYILNIRPRIDGLLLPILASIVSMGAVYGALELTFDIIPAWTLIPAGAGFGLLYLSIFIVMGGFHREDIIIAESLEQRLGLDIDGFKRIIKHFA